MARRGDHRAETIIGRTVWESMSRLWPNYHQWSMLKIRVLLRFRSLTLTGNQLAHATPFTLRPAHEINFPDGLRCRWRPRQGESYGIGPFTPAGLSAARRSSAPRKWPSGRSATLGAAKTQRSATSWRPTPSSSPLRANADIWSLPWSRGGPRRGGRSP